MKIKNEYDDEKSPSTLTPTIHQPIILLSERFKRTRPDKKLLFSADVQVAHNPKPLPPILLDPTTTTNISPSPKLQPTTPKSGKKRSVKIQDKTPQRNSISVVDSGTTQSLEVVEHSAPVNEANEDGEEDEPHPIFGDFHYVPFQLKPKSSFNPGLLSKKHLKNMPMLMKAKYGAYENPAQNLLSKIEESEYRSKIYFQKEEKIIQNMIIDAKVQMEKKRGLCDIAVAQEGAKKAKDRMRQRFNSAMAAKELELQYLVEGQKNSIDAIRLKENLKLYKEKVCLKPILTERERLRVETLIF